jgi:hypothetical protein
VQDAINPNLAGVNDYRIEIAQVQMEYGQNSTPFELNDPTSEFQRCQRYYQTNNRSVPYRNIVNLNPTANNTDSIPIEVSQFFFGYPVEMRNNAYKIETKIDQGLITNLTRSVGGFKANKSGASIVNLNYQAEAEL